MNRIDQSLPVFDLMTLRKYIDDGAAPQQFQRWLLTAVALLLAAMGFGELLHRAVAERAQETGVRLAIGARKLIYFFLSRPLPCRLRIQILC